MWRATALLPWTWRASAGPSIGQHSRAATTATIKTALPGRFVSICSRLVGNIGEAYTVTADPFGGCICRLLQWVCCQIMSPDFGSQSKHCFDQLRQSWYELRRIGIPLPHSFPKLI